MMDKKRLQVAVVGPGRLGQACAVALLDHPDLMLAGLVHHGEKASDLPGRLRQTLRVTHIRDLPAVDLALVCVPPDVATDVTHDLLQARVPIVECARMDKVADAGHYEALSGAALHFRVSAVLGAGWDPGMLPLLTQAFDTLIPRGHTTTHAHPGLTLHHGTATAACTGVEDAVEGEVRAPGGVLQRYVYVKLAPGANLASVRTCLEADPLYAGESTQVFAMDSLDKLAAPVGQGLVIERRASGVSGTSGMHPGLVLDARFDETEFAARVMLRAATQVLSMPQGGHRFSLQMEN